KDARTPSQSCYTWPVTAGVKSLAWDPYNGYHFVASLEDGTVVCFDARVAPAASIFTLHAHTEAVTSVSYNLFGPNILATGSLDQTVKLWDLSNNQPTCVASKNPSVGDIFSISFSEDDRFMLAIGGKIGKLH
ncbi:WD-repeat protein-like protein, partial [Trifolium medium]|nr:WD-repeat protein-like protein [Trifolium medium]